MNQDNSIENMTTWNDLASRHLKVCKDTNKPPFQWIYAVDDAWFHPNGFDSTKYEINPPVWKTITGLCDCDAAVAGMTLPVVQAIISNDTAGITAEDDAETRPSADKINDSEVAKYLINFAVTERNYGVCFCTFEYLWENFPKTINQPQNAIFFDLNHQIAAFLQNDLRLMWDQKLIKLGLYQDNTNKDSKLLGWLLHFAIKFGKLNSAALAIDQNHLLIVSSAIANKGGASDDAMSQYLQVQKSLWNTMSSEGASLGDYQMRDFGFAPLPKVAISTIEESDNMLRTGLAIFDNTFSKAGSWASVQEALKCDLDSLWNQYNKGHPDGDKMPQVNMALRWTTWLPTCDTLRLNTIKNVFHYPDINPNQTRVISLSLLVSILKASGVSAFSGLTAPESDKDIVIPTSPAILFIAGVIDLVSKLANDGRKVDTSDPNAKERAEPEVCIEIGVSDAKLKIKLNTEGVRKLQENYAATLPKTTGATPILISLGKGRVKITGNKLGINIQNKLGEKSFSEIACDHQLPVQLAEDVAQPTITFEVDAMCIVLRFQVF